MNVDSVVEAAIQARDRAYSPYSNYRVGAVLETADGQQFSGCNVENASYGLCICAERTAVVSAVAAGETRFQRIVIATADGAAPCGACRQFLAEFAPDLPIVLVSVDTKQMQELSLGELLPHQFRI